MLFAAAVHVSAQLLHFRNIRSRKREFPPDSVIFQAQWAMILRLLPP
jgi:hypothetical protein